MNDNHKMNYFQQQKIHGQLSTLTIQEQETKIGSWNKAFTASGKNQQFPSEISNKNNSNSVIPVRRPGCVPRAIGPSMSNCTNTMAMNNFRGADQPLHQNIGVNYSFHASADTNLGSVNPNANFNEPAVGTSDLFSLNNRNKRPITADPAIREQGIANDVQRRKVEVNNKNKEDKYIGIAVKVSNQNIRVFTGTVEKVIKWNKVYKEYFCFYEVIASLVSIQEGSVKMQKVLLVKDKRGPIMQVLHYEKDHIQIENFVMGQMLRCVGRMIGPNILHAVSIREASPEELSTLLRMCYVCDHAINRFLTHRI